MRNKEIIQELEELGSPLSGLSPQTVYRVPEGYFEGVAAQVLNRIKAMGTETAAGELSLLSPLLENISKKSPYSVPYDFFSGFEKKLMATIRQQEELQTADEEIAAISPLLSGIGRNNPYSTPQGYFENLGNNINLKSEKPASKVVPMVNRKWFRYAAAAVLIGFITLTGIRFLNNNPGNIMPSSGGIDLNSVSTTEINNFIQTTDEGLADQDKLASSVKTDIQNLLQDVSDKDIQDFLGKTIAGNDETDADILLN